MRNVFTYINLNLYDALYKDLPEETIGERINKLRVRLNISRNKFANSIDIQTELVRHWETNEIIPKAPYIKKISDIYNIPLNYFHDYYYIYYNEPEEAFLKWKKENNYTYRGLGKKMNCSTSTIQFFGGSISKLSYKLYTELKELGVF